MEKKNFLNKLGAALFSAPGLSDLLNMSRNPSGFKRENAVRRLGMIEDPAAIPDLIVRANDWVPQVRAAAREALIKMLTPANGEAFVASLPAVLHLQTCTRDDHNELILAIEQFLLREEHHHFLAAGLKSSDSRVARLAIRLLLKTQASNAVELIMDGLSHTDTVVRVISIDLLKELSPGDFQAVIDRAIRDPYMPVRREAFQQLLSRDLQRGLQFARVFLFDASASIREIAVRRLLEADEQIEEIYAGSLKQSGCRVAVIKCVLWGWGFLKSQTRIDDVRELLGSHYASVRRAALQTISRLLGNAAMPNLEASLSDCSPAVCNEAARLLVRIDDNLQVDELIAIAARSGQRHVAVACCRVSREMSKWDWLKFVLRVYGAPSTPIGAEVLMKEIDAWNCQFNNSAAQPDPHILTELVMALQVCEDRLTVNQARLLKFTLHNYGVSP